MTKSVANVIIATDTFEGWLNKTNILLDTLSNEIITVSNTSGGSVTTGNAVVNGTMEIATIASNTALRGGSITTPNTLNITSDLAVSNASLFTGNVTVTGVGTTVVDAGATTIRGGALQIDSNTTINSTSFAVAVGSINLTAPSGITIASGTSLGDFSAGVVNSVAVRGVGAGFNNIEVISSNTTWTIPTNVTKIKYTVVGAGGGGGAAAKANNTHQYAGGGGGGGGAAIGTIAIPDGVTSITVTVGSGGLGGTLANTTASAVPDAGANATSGGTSSIVVGATTISATGGAGGGYGSQYNRQASAVTSANPGVGSGGDINIYGGYGIPGSWTIISRNYAYVVGGGSSVMGPGPQTDNVDSANSSGLSQAGAGNYADGRNGTNYGTGGSGGIAHRAPAQGGNGADGVVVIEY